MRRLLAILSISILCLISKAAPVKFNYSTPEDKSEISEFNFTLYFDISEAIESVGSGEWGIGYAGNTGGTTPRNATLYEGNIESGVELAQTLNVNFTGKSEGYKINGNTVSLSFPNLTAPKSGQLYTLVITNNFALYAAGKAAPNSSTMCKFENDPLILTFTGSQTASNKAQIQAISIEDNSTLDFLSEITYKFNAPILANSEYQVLVKENSDLFAVSKSAIVENETDLVVKFGENVNLNLGHTYSITLPEGIVELIEDKSVKNNEFTFNVNGAKTYTFALLSVQPSNGEMCLPSTASISYDIPEGYNITGGPNQAINKSLKIYKEEVAEQNLIATYLNGEFNSSKNGLEWDLSRISYEPSTKYVLYREAGLNNLFKMNQTFQ